jgi:hypothetical protein
LPLVVCVYLIRGLWSTTDEEEAANLLIEELTSAHPCFAEPGAASPRSGCLESPSRRIDYRAGPRLEPSTTPCIVVVEGTNDVEFLTRISRILHGAVSTVPDLGQLRAAGQILFKTSDAAARTSLATSTMVGCRQFHLLDRESSIVCQERGQLIDVLNQFPDCRAALTSKRTIENYLHSDAIVEASGIALLFDDTDDVATLAARARLQETAGKTWKSLSPRARRRLRGKAKKWLNRDAVDRMTVGRLAERDTQGEIRSWLLTIAHLASQSGSRADSAGQSFERPS